MVCEPEKCNVPTYVIKMTIPELVGAIVTTLQTDEFIAPALACECFSAGVFGAKFSDPFQKNPMFVVVS